MSDTGNGELLYEGAAVWANSAPVGTVVDLDLPASALGAREPDAKYAITVRNPSTVTALTLTVRNAETLGGALRYPQLGASTYAIPINSPQGRTYVVEGFLIGEGGRLSLSNDTVLGVADGFTADVRVRGL